MDRVLARRSTLAANAVFPRFESLERRRLLAAAVFNEIYVATQQKALLAAVTKAPKKPGRPDLQAGSDDGARSNDDVTSVTKPIFDIDKVDSNTTVQLLRNGVVVASAFSTVGGTVSLRDDGPLAPGSYEYTARMLSTTGVAGDQSPVLKVTIVSPAAPAPTPPPNPAAPDLNAASDSGSSAVDNFTASSSLSFTIPGVASGMNVQLLRDGAIVAAGLAAGASITLTDASASTDGSYSYTAVAVSSAGLSSSPSTALAIVVDRTPPEASAPDLAAAYDFGRSDSDDVTSATNLSFEIAVAENGASVELLRDGIVVAATTASAGVMTLADPATLSDGVCGYSTVVTDAAGNASTSAALAVTVDTTPPTAPTPDLLASSDLGLSDSDNVTSVISLPFAVSVAEDDVLVELLRDGVVVASSTGSAGMMQMSDPATLTDGVYAYATRVTDAAGNISISGALAVTVDATAPGATSAPVLSDASDLGIKGDNATRDRMPVFTVSGAEPYAIVELIENGVVVASTVAGEDGTATLGPSTRLTPGAHNFTARQTDAAGNVSAESAAGSMKIVNALASSDFDGDGISDVAIYTAGTWTIELSSGGTRTATLGGATDVPVPGDYDGDGKTDIAIYRPSGRSIRVMPSSNPDVITVQFISTTFQLPVCADYDGDGKTDYAVYNNSTGVFTIIKSTGGTSTVTMLAGALPAVADYDGDGKADVAVYQPTTGEWTIMQSTGLTVTRHFGAADGPDQPLPADYDGDGFDDLAVYNPASGQLDILGTTMGAVASGLDANAIPVAADFDGDNGFDPATYTQATAMWTIFRTSAGPLYMSLGTPSAANQPLPLSIGQVRKDVLGF